MGYNRKIRNVARMFIFGTFLVQPGNLITKTDKYPKMWNINIADLPGSSCHGTNGHQHFRNQCQQKKMLACKHQKFRHASAPKIKQKSTYSICLRASASSGFFAIFGRFTTVVWSAQEENISATGLLPWYAGRRIGLAGRGVRSVYLSSRVRSQFGDWIYSSPRTELQCNFPCYGTEHQGLRLFARLLDMTRYWAYPMDGRTIQSLWCRNIGMK